MAVVATTGIAVRCHRGRPPVPAGAVEVDVGCDLPVALTSVRRAVEADSSPRADQRPAAAMLALAASSAGPARALSGAIEGGDPAAVAAALPRPGTKLNRPFDMVNL